MGGSLGVTVVTNTTEAFIKNATVAAKGNDSRTITIKDWNASGDESTETIAGVAVIASSSEEFDLISASIGASGDSESDGIGVNIAPTFVTDTTYAYIEDTGVNTSGDRGGDVVVKAHQDTDAFTVVGAASSPPDYRRATSSA